MQKKEKFRTYGAVFDAFTNRKLFELEGKRLFDQLESPIFTGKESNVFTALKDKGRVIVKIYRINTCDFNRMYDYIKYDRRYINLKNQRRKTIYAWTQREYRNLMIARDAGVRVPTPLHRDHHILILEYIGDEEGIAPKLQDYHPMEPEPFFKDVIEQMKKMYKANLIHGDLSSFNILNHNNQPVIIDFSQATTKDNPRADEYLKRDIKNICNFFKKLKVETSEEEVYKQVTGK